MDVETCEPLNKEVSLPRTYKNEDKLMKAVREVVETETVKAVQIVSCDTVETLYGMAEQDFINSAIILDPVTRKPMDDNTDEDDTDEDEE